MVKLTRANFIAWLRSKHPRTRIGISLSGFKRCPLAKFTGGTVTATVYYKNLQAAHKRLPVWARRFVYKADQLHRGRSKSITARQALVILEEKVA